MVHTVVVKGTPKSIQSSPRSKTAWKNKVAQAARRKFRRPLSDTDLKVEITIFYNGVPTYNPDNMSKPIVDAMIGVAYHDDDQVVDRNVRKRPMDGAYIIKGIPSEVATSLADGEDFVWIKMWKLGREVENL